MTDESLDVDHLAGVFWRELLAVHGPALPRWVREGEDRYRPEFRAWVEEGLEGPELRMDAGLGNSPGWEWDEDTAADLDGVARYFARFQGDEIVSDAGMYDDDEKPEWYARWLGKPR